MQTIDEGPALVAPRPRELNGRAGDFRIILSARQEAEAILAAAAEVRRDADLQAELLLAEAEALSRDLADQATAVLDRAIGEARERADGIVAVARASAEDVRRSARAQVAADREAFRAETDSVRREQVPVGGPADDVLADMENTIRMLAATMRQARSSVADAPPEVAATAPTAAADEEELPEDYREPRPLGWLFRSDRS